MKSLSYQLPQKGIGHEHAHSYICLNIEDVKVVYLENNG